ncbi:hypothetical protein [Stappia indica]|uniref:hypothetical protein n=1 Tax=Stappia indica TaxID=538381 RepID=UPI000829813C|nr:hypothetical protein [Stappia indica]
MGDRERPSFEFGTTNNLLWLSGSPSERDVTPGSPKDRDLARSLLDACLVAVPLALGYFAGIAYLDAYLSAFSISIHEVNAPLATIVAHSYTVFTHAGFLWWLALILLVLFGGAIVLWQVRQRQLVSSSFPMHFLVAGAILIASLSVFIAIKTSAEETARTAAQLVWHEANAIVIPRSSLALHESRLSVQQRLRLTRCLDQATIKHVLATPERSFALCVIAKEGFLLSHAVASDRYLPIRRLSPCTDGAWRDMPFCHRKSGG